MTGADWTRLAVTVPAEAAELAADAWWRAGAAAIEVREDGEATTLVAGFADPAEAARARDVAVAEGHGPVRELPIADDGLDAWRAWAEPMAAGPWWVVPAWLDPPAGADPGDVLSIDPGRAFGSGSHPTTRLVLEVLAELVGPGDRVLDVGCGSGVLAVAAARRGGSATGIDVDPEARPVTLANAAANGVADAVEVLDATVAELAGTGRRWDVVAANLLAPVLAEVGPDLVELLAPGGSLVVSGLLEDRWEATLPHLAPLEVRAVRAAEGWVAVVVGRPDPPG